MGLAWMLTGSEDVWAAPFGDLGGILPWLGFKSRPMDPKSDIIQCKLLTLGRKWYTSCV